MAASKDVIPLSATTHLPTKLGDNNFPVWKKQLETTLFGYNLLGFIDGSHPPPAAKSADNKPNPDYIIWSRQDQFILSAMLGSCVETIQPSISSAHTSQDAWERLTTLFASQSRSRILTLKAKLIQNPRGSRSIRTYMNEVRSITDALAMVDSPVSEEDLFLSVITQLGPEFRDITAALRARDTAISFDTLMAKLEDFEAQLTRDPTSDTAPFTVNYTTKNNRTRSSQYPSRQPTQNRNQWRPSPSNQSHQRPQNQTPFASRASSFCHYCNRPNHDTKECRKLARFLSEFGISPQVNATSVQPPNSSSWLFDSGASHHVTTDLSGLDSYQSYGGPDVINLGDGSGLPITHTGHTSIHTPTKDLKLKNVFFGCTFLFMWMILS